MDVLCYHEIGGLFSCVVDELRIPNNQAYSIQVAAQNNYGETVYSVILSTYLFQYPVRATYIIMAISVSYKSA